MLFRSGLHRGNGRTVHATTVGHADGIADSDVVLRKGDDGVGRAFAGGSDYDAELARGSFGGLLKAVDAHGLLLNLVGQGDLQPRGDLIQAALQRGDVALLHLDGIRHSEHVQGELGTGKGEFEGLVRLNEGQRIVALAASNGLRVVGGVHVGSVDLIVGKHLAVTTLKVDVGVVGDVAGNLVNVLSHCVSTSLGFDDGYAKPLLSGIVDGIPGAARLPVINGNEMVCFIYQPAIPLMETGRRILLADLNHFVCLR